MPKVIKAEAGAALMRKPEKAQAILKAMVDAVSIPVTVKMRTGWDDESINVLELVRRFEDVGVAAIAVHGRTKEQGRSGRANWEIIGEVKQAVTIPVIGNGDVFTPQDAKAMLEMTGCDAVMIGRGALGEPLDLSAAPCTTSKPASSCPSRTLLERVDMARRHLLLLAELKGERTATHRDAAARAPVFQGLSGCGGFPGQATSGARASKSTTTSLPK